MSNYPELNLPERTNRIHIGFSDCLQVEVESNELNFKELKKEALNLVETIKSDIMKSKTKPNPIDAV
jgi:hypothetical protein